MRRTSAPAVLLLAALTVALAGCSRMPTAPELDSTLVRGNGTLALGQVDDPPAPIEAQAGLVNSITLAEGQGGTVKVGRFTLVIHKESLKMGATIAIRQPDSAVMQVEFEVRPAAANDFRVPVQLVADCSNDPLSEVQEETMYWWNGLWQEASAVSLNHASRSLTAHTHRLMNGKVDTRGQDVGKHKGN